MNLTESVKNNFRMFASATGRASRSEFWYWMLFTLLAESVLAVLDRIIFGKHGFSPLMSLFDIVAFLPSVAVGVRRLHDTDRSWWWWLTSIILVPWLIAICQKGTEGPNRFGADPLAEPTPSPSLP